MHPLAALQLALLAQGSEEYHCRLHYPAVRCAGASLAESRRSSARCRKAWFRFSLAAA